MCCNVYVYVYVYVYVFVYVYVNIYIYIFNTCIRTYVAIMLYMRRIYIQTIPSCKLTCFPWKKLPCSLILLLGLDPWPIDPLGPPKFFKGFLFSKMIFLFPTGEICRSFPGNRSFPTTRGDWRRRSPSPWGWFAWANFFTTKRTKRVTEEW